MLLLLALPLMGETVDTVDSRQLQSTLVQETCQELQQQPLFRSCDCGAQANGIAIDCSNLCTQCVEGLCVDYSFVTRYQPEGDSSYYVAFVQTTEVQRRNSAVTTVVQEQSMNAQGDVINCQTRIDGVSCTSCSVVNNCPVHDCRNLVGGSIVDSCDATAVQGLSRTHPLVTLNAELISVLDCVEDTPPPKKNVRNDNKNDESKLYGGDAGRGGLTRRLKGL